VYSRIVYGIAFDIVYHLLKRPVERPQQINSARQRALMPAKVVARMYRFEAYPPRDGKDAPMQTNATRLLLLAAQSGDAAARFNLTVLCDSRQD